MHYMHKTVRKGNPNWIFTINVNTQCTNNKRKCVSLEKSCISISRKLWILILKKLWISTLKWSWISFNYKTISIATDGNCPPDFLSLKGLIIYHTNITESENQLSKVRVQSIHQNNLKSTTYVLGKWLNPLSVS